MAHLMLKYLFKTYHILTISLNALLFLSKFQKKKILEDFLKIDHKYDKSLYISYSIKKSSYYYVRII